MTNKQKLLQLKRELCSEVEKEFKFIGGDELTFNRPFVVHISVGNFSGESNSERYLVTGIISGRELVFEDKSGTTYQDLEVSDLEDLMDIAHILDELQTNNVKIINYE